MGTRRRWLLSHHYTSDVVGRRLTVYGDVVAVRGPPEVTHLGQ